MKYKCRVIRKDGSVCDYETDSSHGYAGHVGGHVKRGELKKGDLKKGELKVEKIVVKPEDLVNPAKVADALLERVVVTLRNHDTLVGEAKESRGWKVRALELERSLESVRQEKDRIIKIHNEQAKRGQFTSGQELLRLAKLR